MFSADSLIETALIVCGDKVTAGYFQLLDLQISEFLLTVEAWLMLARKREKQRERKNSSGKWTSVL